MNDSLFVLKDNPELDLKKSTILWVHGYTLNSNIWEPLWGKLPGWNHIAVDLPGHGQSRPLNEYDNLISVSEDLVTVAKQYQISHLIGLSFGGIVAMQVAAMLEGDLEHLVLAASGLGDGPIDAAATERNMELIRLYKEKGTGPWMTELWMRSPPDIFTGARQHPTLLSKLTEQVEKHSWAELSSVVMQKICQHSQSAYELNTLSAKTLILVGENDMPVFKRTAQIIKGAIKETIRHYISDAGHLCLLEQPEKSANIIAQHLRT